MEVIKFARAVESVSYIQTYPRKDKTVGIILTDLNTKVNFAMSSLQLKKIIENPGKPITIRKAYTPMDGRSGNGQEMVAYFEKKSCFIVYVGKIGRTIKNLRTDIATNGEIEIIVDMKQVISVLNGVLAHEFAINVANKREDERIDYLDSVVELPEGKWYSEDDIDEEN